MKTKILLTSLLLGSVLSAAFVDHVGARLGVSKAIMKEHDNSKIDINSVESFGPMYDLSAAFNVADEGFFKSFKPYIDYSGRYYDDRIINIATVGLYYPFGSWKGFEPYAAAGLGYSFSDWKQSPLENTSDKNTGNSSFSGSLEGGLNYELSDAFDLTFGARFDAYRMETKFKTEDHTTTLRDDYALSALVGIRYYFDRGEKELEDEADVAPVAAAAAATAAVASESDALAVIPICDLSTINRRVYFDYASPDISERAKPDLDIVAACLKDHPDTKVEFEGHTDSKGSAKFNQTLSEKRSDSAKAYVGAQGIDASRMKTSGRGEMDPVASNKTDEGRAQNRRVDIYFIDGMVPVHFAYNSASLKGEVSKLDGVLDFMKHNSESSITIVGHTDKIGSQNYNLKLSKKRAAAVRNFLVGNGIESSRIKMIAKGKVEPIADNTTDEGRAKNRRAEMNLRH
jgi:outer membrane protein OmpA-like peptidoglycan-associated protein